MDIDRWGFASQIRMSSTLLPRDKYALALHYREGSLMLKIIIPLQIIIINKPATFYIYHEIYISVGKIGIYIHVLFFFFFFLALE